MKLAKAQCDETDKKILNLLLKDSKQSLREMSNKLGMKIDSVHRRIRMMQQANIIRKYIAVPDFDALGYSQLAFVVLKLNNFSRERRQELNNYLVRNEKFPEIYTTMGDWDYSVTMLAKNKHELNAEINMLREKFKDIISNWTCLIVLDINKIMTYQLT